MTATSIAGIQRFSGRHSSAPAIVTMPTIGAEGCTLSIVNDAARSVSNTDRPRDSGRPRNAPTWLLMIRIAAPAVKPTITECGTRSTRRPARASPSSSCIAPTRKVSVSTSATYWPEPAAASGAISARVVSEIAFAGPVTIRRLEPNSAATMHGTIAEYRPYCGGMPASVAKARPCGSTTTAPVRPASRSARTTPGCRSSGSQRANGSERGRASGTRGI